MKAEDPKLSFVPLLKILQKGNYFEVRNLVIHPHLIESFEKISAFLEEGFICKYCCFFCCLTTLPRNRVGIHLGSRA